MEQLLEDLLKSFDNNEFADTLNLAEQILKKQKKSNKLTALQLANTSLLKAGALACLGQLHTYHIVSKQIFSNHVLVKEFGQSMPIYLLSIAELSLDSLEAELFQIIQPQLQSKQVEYTYRFFLSCKAFSALGKLFFQDYMKTRNLGYFLGQIQLQFLACLSTAGAVDHKLNQCYVPLQCDFKQIKSFLGKFNDINSKSRSAVQAKVTEESVHQTTMLLDMERLKADLDKLKTIQEENSDISKKEKEELKKIREEEIKKVQAELNSKLEKLQSIEQQKRNLNTAQKFQQQANFLQLRLAIHENRPQDAIELFCKNKSALRDPFKYMRSILKLPTSEQLQSRANREFYVSEMASVFRKNLDLAHYTPLYDNYNEFLQLVLDQVKKELGSEHNTKLQSSRTVPFDEMYNFGNRTSLMLLKHYYHSLLTEYTLLTSTKGNETVSKSDYYKICIKGLLLQCLRISSAFDQESLVELLSEYTRHFSKTLTYAAELKDYWQTLIQHAVLCPEPVQDDNSLIIHINYTKISLSVSTTSFSGQNILEVVDKLTEAYRQHKHNIEKDRPLSKGELYLSDEYLVILSDYIRGFLEGDDDVAEGDTPDALTLRIIDILDAAIQVSPYNADLKLRFMHFCSLMNYSNDIIATFNTMDIKSVQLQTLSYWAIRPILLFGSEQDDELISNMLRNYAQAIRQSAKYAHKALKDGCLEQSEEYLSYRDYICNSYNEQMMFYMHYHRYQFEQGSEYYLTKIVRKLANIDALNCNSDGEVMKNQVFPDITFTDFYGLYNDPRLLHSETCIRLLEEGLIDRIDGRKSELPYRFEDLDVHQREIDRIRPEDVLGVLRFKRYHGKRITGRMNKRKIHLVGMELRNYKQLVDLKCDTLRIGQRINTMLQEGKDWNTELAHLAVLAEKFLHRVRDVNSFLCTMSPNMQAKVVVTVRREVLDCVNMLSLLFGKVTSRKEKRWRNQQVGLQELLTKCIEAAKSFIIDFRLKQSESLLSIASEKNRAREAQLQESLHFQKKDAKRILDRYMSKNSSK